MANFYYKISTPLGIRYCCFTAQDEQTAIRKALISCFKDDHEDKYGVVLRTAYPDFDTRCKLLHDKYGHRISQTDEVTYLEMDKYQMD